jgi:hypothetical protein
MSAVWLTYWFVVTIQRSWSSDRDSRCFPAEVNVLSWMWASPQLGRLGLRVTYHCSKYASNFRYLLIGYAPKHSRIDITEKWVYSYVISCNSVSAISQKFCKLKLISYNPLHRWIWAHKKKLRGLSPRANYSDRRSRRGGSSTAVISFFLDRSRYFFFQVAPQLYSRGWVDPVPDPLLLWRSGSAGNRTRTSGSVATKQQRRSGSGHVCYKAVMIRLSWK